MIALRAQLVAAEEPAVQPPRVVSLPEIAVPPDVAIPEDGKVEAVIVVQVDGSARSETCSAAEDLCALVTAALAEARFEPAQREGAAIAARIRIALRVTRPASAADPDADAGIPEVDAAVGGNVVEPPLAAAAVVETEPTDEGYGAHAQVKQLKQPGMRRLELAELRDMPGAFGDPFRAVEVLPGIVPFLSGLPYFYVRGSPPAGSIYVYDGIPIPSLYHMALGPAVVHPQMVGPIRLYSGVAPARYGRLTGGVIVGEGPDSSRAGTRGEAELRLLDVSGFVQTDALGGTLDVAGRYGYPGLLISLISPDVDVAYWDYQLRYALPLSRRIRLELVGLGSFDRLSTGTAYDETLSLQFHRLEPRFVYHTMQDELGIALMLGWEESALGETLGIGSKRLAPRAWYEHRFDGGYRLRLSADAQNIWGGRTRQAGDDAAIDSLGFRGLGQGYRAVLGAQLELTLPLTAAFEIQAGARVDAWVQANRAYPAVDPRLRAVVHASETVDVHVAAGTTHQPAVPIIPLPGLADFADASLLQRALQLETGVGVDLPIDLHAELQLFAHRYNNLVFADTLTSGSFDDLCQREDCMGRKLPPQVNGWSYGMELFLRRPFTSTLSGVLSYTLAWSDLQRVLGTTYTPSWDVRHLVNLVLQWEIGGGFALGVRGFFRSGKPSGDFYVADSMFGRTERRLPGFFRGDLQLSYSWKNAWARMRFGLEWFNFSISREPLSIQKCSPPAMSCSVEYAPAIFAPNLSLRADIQ
ncbi:MAG TPA: TonB-dependent receptor [Polyangiales bacterium]|nr:TonB-dependent receptor [Polyangiales bacterium]